MLNATQFLDFAQKTPVIGKFILWVERKMFYRYIARHRRRVGDDIERRLGGTISGGIFSGMKLHPKSSWGTDKFTVLTGQYEKEIYPVMSEAIARNCDCFIDIGCANGFYAVGFARSSPKTDVIAYDISEQARATTIANAELNDVVRRISVRDKADHLGLSEVIGQYDSVFILVDIEGAELELLNPKSCPELRRCNLLVEVHGDTEASIAELARRFADTHTFCSIARAARNPFEYADLECQFEDEAWISVSEGRRFARNNWIHLQTKPTIIIQAEESTA